MSSDSMPNLFTNAGNQIIHLTEQNFIDLPVSKEMRFYHPRDRQEDCGAIILVYAPWCPHCRDPRWMAMYEALAQFLAKNNVHAYAMNATIPGNLRWTDKMEINGLPTILFANRQGELAEYEGERELQPMVKGLVSYLMDTNDRKKLTRGEKKRVEKRKKTRRGGPRRK